LAVAKPYFDLKNLPGFDSRPTQEKYLAKHQVSRAHSITLFNNLTPDSCHCSGFIAILGKLSDLLSKLQRNHIDIDVKKCYTKIRRVFITANGWGH